MSDDNLTLSPVLTGWKEIAKYLHMGIRTVQRHEREQKLPVRRLSENSRGPVIATKLELDLWVTSFPKRRDANDLRRPQPERDGLETHILQAKKLRVETLGLRDQLLGSIARLQKTIHISQSRMKGAVTAKTTSHDVAETSVASTL